MEKAINTLCLFMAASALGTGIGFLQGLIAFSYMQYHYRCVFVGSAAFIGLLAGVAVCLVFILRSSGRDLLSQSVLCWTKIISTIAGLGFVASFMIAWLRPEISWFSGVITLLIALFAVLFWIR